MFTNEYYNNEMETNDLELEALISNKKKIMTCCYVITFCQQIQYIFLCAHFILSLFITYSILLQISNNTT